MSHDTILNVNVPDVPLADIQGFQTTRLGKRHQSEKSIPDKDDASKFWIGENGAQADNGRGYRFSCNCQ
ncbi:5-nucleotidase SurE (EC [uncultured Gammaproteobacteria bacterium]|nr:5-nucleotidase SurE (EC [uncultured Gammaproteobacteria bacterium]